MKSREEKIAYLREYRKRNKVAIAAKRKKKREENPALIRAQQHKSWEKNKEKRSAESAEWYQKNKKEVSKRRKAKYKADKKNGTPYSLAYYYKVKHTEAYKVKDFIRHSIGNILRKAKYETGALNSLFKDTSHDKIRFVLGCNLSEFIDHIESQLARGMSWKNHGEWELDHVFPVSKCIELYGPEKSLTLVNHYTNLQPLWFDDNRRKGAKI